MLELLDSTKGGQGGQGGQAVTSKEEALVNMFSPVKKTVSLGGIAGGNGLFSLTESLSSDNSNSKLLSGPATSATPPTRNIENIDHQARKATSKQKKKGTATRKMKNSKNDNSEGKKRKKMTAREKERQLLARTQKVDEMIGKLEVRMTRRTRVERMCHVRGTALTLLVHKTGLIAVFFLFFSCVSLFTSPAYSQNKPAITEEEIDAIVMFMDNDGSGDVDQEEFAFAIKQAKKGLVEDESITKLLTKLDNELRVKQIR